MADGGSNGGMRVLQAGCYGTTTALVGWILVTVVNLTGRVSVVERTSSDVWDTAVERSERLTRVEAKIDFLVEQVAEIKRLPK